MSELILVLNSVEAQLQIVLGSSSETLFCAHWQSGGQGVEQVAPMLEAALQCKSLDRQKIGKIAVVHGPGSFTGIRLGLTMSAGLARAVGARQAALTLGQCQAQSLAGVMPEGTLLATINHARSNLVYLQLFKVCAESVQAVHASLLNGAMKALNAQDDECSAALVLSPEQVLTMLQPLCESSVLVLLGSGLAKNSEAFRALKGAIILSQSFSIPSAQALLDLARTANYQENDLEPLYLRRSDAEDNLPQIAKNLGLDPAKAEDDLKRLTSATVIYKQ